MQFEDSGQIEVLPPVRALCGHQGAQPPRESLRDRLHF